MEKKNNKVVVVNDCAHVMETLIPSLQNEFDIKFVKRTRGLWDKTFGILWKIIRSKGTIFHVNYALQDAYLTSKLKHLDILHAHGSDVRWIINSRKYGRIVRSNLKSANIILYSTKDLAEPISKYRSDARYLPNPIDTNMFQQRTYFNKSLQAVYFKKYYETLPLGLEPLLSKNMIKLNVQVNNAIPYGHMPNFLRRYDILIDRFQIASSSKVCLEAMSSGLAVIDSRHSDDLEDRVAYLSDVNNVKKDGVENRKFIMENHSVEKVAPILADVWKLAIEDVHKVEDPR
jgi:hypothetical protein